MKTVALITFLLIISPLSYSATINIPADYPTIQQGIDAAVNGDTVLVAPGTYLENIDFEGKAITLKSELGPDVTTIDGNRAGSVVIFENQETTNSVLDGFKITNGTGTSHDNRVDGGGIFCKQS